MRATGEPRHLHSLDIARGLAALAVVLWHWQHFFFVGTQLRSDFQPDRLPLHGVLRVFYEHGSLAVSLFFSLSGFVFFWLYSSQIATGSLKLRAFFAQRRTWASRAMRRAFCDARIARLARFLTAFRRCLPLLSLTVLPAAHGATTPKDLLAAGRADQAIESLHSAPDAESQNLLCRAYFMVEQWDRAVSTCERAVNLDPQKSLYHLWLGRTYGEKADRAGFLSAAGLAKKVHTEFERAVALDPSNVAARTDLAEFYLEAPGIVGGGKDKARAEADALAPLDPGMSHWVIGRMAEKNKDNVTAEREYRAAIEASHGGIQAWLHLAQFFARTNRWDETEQAMRTLESRPVDRPDSLMDAASLLLRNGRDYPMAVRLLRRYLLSPAEEGPAFKAHNFLGQILEKQGDRQAAVEEYRAALALAHEFTRAQENLKRVTH